MQKHSWLFEKISKYLLAAVLIIVPLFPKFPLLTVTGTYVAIRFEDLLMFFLAILMGLKIVQNPKDFFRDKIFQAFLIFFGVGAVSLFSAVFLTQTAGFKIGLLHLLRRVEYIIPFVAVLSLLSKEKTKEYLHFYTKLLLIATLVAFGYGIGQRYFHFPIIITQNEEYSKGVALFWTPGAHINSTFAGHYDLAAVMVLVLPIFITMFFVLKDHMAKITIFLVSVSGFWLLVNSLSRIAQVSYIVAVAISLILVRKFKALFVVIAISLVFISASSGLGVRFKRLFDVYFQKMSISVNSAKNSFVVYAEELPQKRINTDTPPPTPAPVFEDRSTSIRLNVEWPRAIRAFSKNFIVGTGYSSINLATDNDYLRLLGEVGILGFLAFWLIFWRIGRELSQGLLIDKNFTGLSKGFFAGAIGGSFATFVSAFFLDIFEASKFAILFWFILGLAVMLVRNKKYA